MYDWYTMGSQQYIHFIERQPRTAVSTVAIISIYTTHPLPQLHGHEGTRRDMVEYNFFQLPTALILQCIVPSNRSAQTEFLKYYVAFVPLQYI